MNQTTLVAVVAQHLFSCKSPRPHSRPMQQVVSMDVRLVRASRRDRLVLVKLECEPAPLILGYVLGPLME
ncbi:MAG TPA: hypothetical protein VK143_02110 [Burkholderiales bacterium]|nr:hypothetical protein [Burkholderiales bacterium]